MRTIPVGTRVSSSPVLMTPAGVRVIGQSEEAPGGFGEYFLMTVAITQVVPTDLPDGGPPAGEHLHTMTAKRRGLKMQFGGGPTMGHWSAAFEAVC
jgi:hypothetical protein